jgi:iron-sulfur cluster assembly accessory protein
MIHLTDKAARELANMLASQPSPGHTGLRLAVRRGGCAGWQYEMKVAPAEAGDHVAESGGARLIIAADSIERLRGCEIDFSDDLTDSGFKVNNPNAARSCGCGTSFETVDEPASAEAIAAEGSCGNS